MEIVESRKVRVDSSKEKYKDKYKDKSKDCSKKP